MFATAPATRSRARDTRPLAARGSSRGPAGLCGLADVGLDGQVDGGTAVPPEPEPNPCTPDCDDRSCGTDGCGGICGECEIGDACEAGLCIARDSGGSLSCLEVVECLQFCNTESCFNDCFDDGISEARELYRAATVCIDENCAQLQDDLEAFSDCQYERCPQELEECFNDE